MNWFEALILGLIQGLSEFLPVSSSGHLELGKIVMGVESKSSLMFTVIVHGATVLSTIVVFWKDIVKLFTGLFQFKWNEETQYIFKIGVSMIPVVIVGLFFEEEVEQLFSGNLLLVGAMLIVTALLLGFTFWAKNGSKNISFGHALIIGMAQAFAVIPGVSRSGSTIATGLLLGNKRTEVSRFSFLMVLVPIIGANVKSVMGADFSNDASIGALPLVIGFIAAFSVGLLACKWMIKIVNKGKLIWFAAYVFVVGAFSVAYALMA